MANFTDLGAEIGIELRSPARWDSSTTSCVTGPTGSSVQRRDLKCLVFLRQKEMLAWARLWMRWLHLRLLWILSVTLTTHQWSSGLQKVLHVVHSITQTILPTIDSILTSPFFRKQLTWSKIISLWSFLLLPAQKDTESWKNASPDSSSEWSFHMLGYGPIHLCTIADIGLCLWNWYAAMLRTTFCTLCLPLCSTHCTLLCMVLSELLEYHAKQSILLDLGIHDNNKTNHVYHPVGSKTRHFTFPLH